MIKVVKLAVLLAAIGAALGAAPRSILSVGDNSNALKIVGGTPTDISLHPFLVSIQHLNEPFCGGFLISSNWVVTAAHCLIQGYKTDLNIRAGSSLTTSGGQTANVTSYKIHQNFSVSTADSDIALLYLDTHINVDNTQAASLPTAGQEIPDNVLVTITGWGDTDESGSNSGELLQTQVPSVNSSICKEAYPLHYIITDNMFCAGLIGVGGKDSCYGDSGGPVEANGQVIGIVSWGAGCGEPDHPGVYTKVSNFRTWITENTGI